MFIFTRTFHVIKYHIRKEESRHSRELTEWVGELPFPGIIKTRRVKKLYIKKKNPIILWRVKRFKRLLLQTRPNVERQTRKTRCFLDYQWLAHFQDEDERPREVQWKVSIGITFLVGRTLSRTTNSLLLPFDGTMARTVRCCPQTDVANICNSRGILRPHRDRVSEKWYIKTKTYKKT
jgi:hypothetical protein